MGGRTARIKVTTYLLPETKKWVDGTVARLQQSGHHRETASSVIETFVLEKQEQEGRPIQRAHGARKRPG